MRLIRLIYSGRLRDHQKDGVVLDIFKTAHAFNNEHHISGLLVFGDNHFLQCLEGEASMVKNLYRRIIQDKRHHEITLLEYKEVQERLFKGWTLKLVMMHPGTKEKLATKVDRKYLETFSPSLMDSHIARVVLMSLAQD